MELLPLFIKNAKELKKSDRKSVFYLIYYSMIESILLLISPLASAFIINSILAHASLSVMVLSFIIIFVFFMIAILQAIRTYILEKFEQSIFINQSIKVALLSIALKGEVHQSEMDKYMNYFFDVLSLQKSIPSLIINSVSLVIKLTIALIILLIFDHTLFITGLIFITLFLFIQLFLGRKGADAAVARSNAKHESIYYLQKIPFSNESSNTKILDEYNELLKVFIKARGKMFKIVIKQLSLGYFIEGFMLSTFFILGGYLVFEGKMPIGEFVAAEIIIISLSYAIRDFMKQLDYFYDAVEGLYKVNKLSSLLEKK